MTTIIYKFATSAVLLAVLAACGGGGSAPPPLPSNMVMQPNGTVTMTVPAAATPAATAPTSVVITPATSAAGASALTKYIGVWKNCSKYVKYTDTITQTVGSNTLDINAKAEVYENADCTGSVRTTATYSQIRGTFKFINSVESASVKLLSGETVVALVDRIDITTNANTLIVTGAGAPENIVDGKATTWYVKHADGGGVYFSMNTTAATSQGALMLRGDALDSLSLTGINGTQFSFRSNVQSIR